MPVVSFVLTETFHHEDSSVRGFAPSHCKANGENRIVLKNGDFFCHWFQGLYSVWGSEWSLCFGHLSSDPEEQILV